MPAVLRAKYYAAQSAAEYCLTGARRAIMDAAQPTLKSESEDTPMKSIALDTAWKFYRETTEEPPFMTISRKNQEAEG